MFRKSLLTLTALTAISTVSTTVTSIDAVAKVRIANSAMVKPKPVKVRVRAVRANKKVRIRTVRPKIRVRINHRPRCASYSIPPSRRCQKAPEQVLAKRKVSPVVRAKVSKVNPGVGTRASNPYFDRLVAFAAAKGKPWVTSTGYPSFAYPHPAFAAEADKYAGVKDAKAAAEALKQMKEFTHLASYGQSWQDVTNVFAAKDNNTTQNKPDGDFTGPVGWNTPSGFGDPSNSGFGRNGAGVGSDLWLVAGGNTHSKDAKTPGNPFAVTPESIADVMGGVAGQRSHSPRYPDGPVRMLVHNVKDAAGETVTFADDARFLNRDAITLSFTKHHNDGSRTIHVTTMLNSSDLNQQIEIDRNGRVTSREGSITPPGDGPVEPRGRTAAQLRNPDYVDGGDVNCRTVHCIMFGNGKPKGLTMANIKSGTRVNPGPQGGNTAPRTTGKPVVASADLVSKYDPDSRNNGDGRPIDWSKVKSD